MPVLMVPPRLLRRVPHLGAFFPGSELRPWGRPWERPWRRGADAAAPLLLAPGDHAPPGVRIIRLDPAPWHPASFAGRAAPVALVAGEGAAPADPAGAAAVLARLAEARLGGTPGLPDPGPIALGCHRGAAVLVLDPCAPEHAGAAALLLRAATAAAAGRPVRVVRSPAATGRPVLPGAAPRLAPWTLLDTAAELWCLPDELALLADALGIPLRGPGAAAFAGQPPGALLAGRIAATRCADPFRHRPWTLAQALDQLADWAAAEAANRRIAVCLGMASWKRRAMAATFASSRGVPAFRATACGALAEALRRGGAIAAWASSLPPGLPAEAAAAGVPLIRVEDGFLRSPGLGARFLPGGSVAADGLGVHYDAAAPSELERLLSGAEFPPPLLARAAALRATLVARGITKYNLPGAALDLPASPGRRRILVPGQVEDDAQLRLPGRGIRGNAALLAAVRAAEPSAFIFYKPHPDLAAGFRRGRLPRAAILAQADAILPGDLPLTPLFGQVDALHTLSSLSGFEALLRGLPVTTWGRPFYAGWGLTEDRDPPPRRGRRRTLDDLVAAALILYPRYLDPVTGLPCPVEVLVERLEHPELWRSGGARARIRAVEGALRRAWAAWQGRL